MNGRANLITILHNRTIAQLLLVTTALFWLPSTVLADASGTFVYTKRFDGESIVLEVEWTYVRAVPSLTFGEPRVIWSGAGAAEGQAGSDGLFYNPAGDLLVGNWQSNAFWKFDPSKTDEVIEGPSDNALAFHSLLHPNEEDFLATNAFGRITCNEGEDACIGVYDHTPLVTSTICLIPLESASQDLLQPVTFIADENLNLFTIFSDGRDCMGCPEGTGIQFGGGGFASFDLDTTTSTNCSGAMQMTRLIPQEISAAHSISWDPFLSNANDNSDPHSDFIMFANSRLTHVRVDDPGSLGATGQVVSTVDMANEGSCASLLPEGMNEFDQGAVNGEGIALVGDEATGFVALIDYSQNSNGTMLDPENMVCLTSFLSSGIDDIAPLTGLGAKFFSGQEFDINYGLAGGWFNTDTPGQGFLFDFLLDSQFMFAANFTFDTIGALSNTKKGHPARTEVMQFDGLEQRWFTAQGNYSGNRADLTIFQTRNGVFDNPAEVDTVAVGTMVIEFTSCTAAIVTYDLPGFGLSGTIPISKLLADEICTQINDGSIPLSKGGNATTSTSRLTQDINYGLIGGWFNTATPGQGYLFDFLLASQFMFVAAFTFDTISPQSGGNISGAEQRWFTAQGNYSGDRADLTIFQTRNGVFDDPAEVTTVAVGTMVIEFTSCTRATLTYDLPGFGLSGTIPISKLLADEICTQINDGGIVLSR